MKLTRFSGLLAVALTVGSVAAYAAGNYSMYPIVGGASFCASTVSGAGGFNAAGNTNNVNPTGQGQATSGSLCAQTVPAGPPTLTGNELIPMDTGAGSGVNPQTVVLPSTSLGNGFGTTTINATTGAQTPAVADGVSTYIYSGAGAATFTTFTFPPNPMQNQKLCLVNAGTGIITLSSLLVGTTGQVFVGTTPTSLPVMTAVGTAGTVTLGTNCWMYTVAAKTWYRVL